MHNELLKRMDGETDLSYHKMLIYSKILDKTLSDVSYQELSDLLYGQHYSEDVCRRLAYGSCRTLQLMDKERVAGCMDKDIIDEIEMKRIELMKERQRFFDQRAAFNKLVRERARQEELNDIIVRAVNEGSLPALDYIPVSVAESDNDLIVSLNDIHYGANVDNYWCKYNSDVCREMFGRYLERIIQIAQTHHSENCIVWANGDLISGSIHHTIQVSNKENVIEQIMGVSELIAEFLAILSRHFNSVKFISVAGNHSRIDQKDRAVAQERLDDLVEWYLKPRLKEFANVEIGYGEKIDATMYVMNVRGQNYVGIHGDYDPSPAHIQSLQTMVAKPVHAVLLGHKHHNQINMVQGIRTVMAGSFMGMDDFCISRRIYGKPEQMVCVCGNRGIVCSYDIDLKE